MFDKQTYAMVDRLIRIRFGGSFRDPRERRRFRAIGPIKDKKSAGDAILALRKIEENFLSRRYVAMGDSCLMKYTLECRELLHYATTGVDLEYWRDTMGILESGVRNLGR